MGVFVCCPDKPLMRAPGRRTTALQVFRDDFPGDGAVKSSRRHEVEHCNAQAEAAQDREHSIESLETRVAEEDEPKHERYGDHRLCDNSTPSDDIVIESRPGRLKKTLSVKRIQMYLIHVGPKPLSRHQVSGFMHEQHAEVADDADDSYDRFAPGVQKHQHQNEKNRPVKVYIDAFDAENACEASKFTRFGELDQWRHGSET